MVQTRAGAEKTAAKMAGLSIEEYAARIDRGLKRCTKCKEWKLRDQFNRDRSRHDGTGASCSSCQSARGKAAYVAIPLAEQRPKGPKPDPQRDGDKIQARSRVNTLVAHGKLPRPETLRCVRCNHIGPGSRHEYHHHNGYGAGHHEDVVVLCALCHRHIESPKALQTHCIHGHHFRETNTAWNKTGQRICISCRTRREAARGPRGREYWQRVNEKRRDKLKAYREGRRNG